MATLISYESSGGWRGRCDAKCYDATKPECDCICRGANHGAGLGKALQNTRELAETWVEEFKQAHPTEDLRWEIPTLQLSLLDYGRAS